MKTVFAVFAQSYTSPGDSVFLAVYSSAELAQKLVDQQEDAVRECLAVVELEIDRHPRSDFWKVPGPSD